MNDNFLKNLMKQVKKAALRKERRALLVELAEKWKGHDYGDEVLDDCWIETVCPEAAHYLTPAEIAALEASSDEEEDGTRWGAWPNTAQATGELVILREFVIYLCGCYGIEAKDLAERED